MHANGDLYYYDSEKVREPGLTNDSCGIVNEPDLAETCAFDSVKYS